MATLKGKDLYAILEAPSDASSNELKKAFWTKAHAVHPNFHPDDPTANEKMAELNLAYEILSDPGSRAEYDAARAAFIGKFGADKRAAERRSKFGGATAAPHLSADDLEKLVKDWWSLGNISTDDLMGRVNPEQYDELDKIINRYTDAYFAGKDKSGWQQPFTPPMRDHGASAERPTGKSGAYQQPASQSISDQELESRIRQWDLGEIITSALYERLGPEQRRRIPDLMNAYLKQQREEATKARLVNEAEQAAKPSTYTGPISSGISDETLKARIILRWNGKITTAELAEGLEGKERERLKPLMDELHETKKREALINSEKAQHKLDDEFVSKLRDVS